MHQNVSWGFASHPIGSIPLIIEQCKALSTLARLSPFLADCRQIGRQALFSATVAEFGDK